MIGGEAIVSFLWCDTPDNAEVTRGALDIKMVNDYLLSFDFQLHSLQTH